MIEYLEAIDDKLFAFLNGRHSEFFDRVMWFVSGIPQWIPLYLLILGWIIYKFRRKSLLIILALALLITLSDQISVQIKMAVDRLRPCQDPDIRDWVHLVKDHCGGMFGFVSSHAANSFAFAVFTSLLLKNRYYVIFILLWASVVSYSRIYLGVHYPGDVLCGALLGVMLAFLVYLVIQGGERKFLRRIDFDPSEILRSREGQRNIPNPASQIFSTYCSMMVRTSSAFNGRREYARLRRLLQMRETLCFFRNS